MKGIEILIRQHESVLTFVDVVKNKCIKIFNKEENIDLDFFNKVLYYGRNFIDGHHHKEEEEILFKVMTSSLGEQISHIINDAMLFEHNVGRMFLMNLNYGIQEFDMYREESYKLSIITNAFNYVCLMEEHINKENEVLYPYADNNLNESDKNFVNNEIEQYEVNADKVGIQLQYSGILNELKNM